MLLETPLENARIAVQRAARVCAAIQNSIAGQSLTKDDRSPVTAADLAAQVIIIAHLQATHPNISIVAEESAAILRGPDAALWRSKVTTLVRDVYPEITEADVLSILDRGQYEGGSAGAFWVIDPIDGTKGFLRGDHYAIALGLVENGALMLGVLGCPNLEHLDHKGCIYSGLVGSGAWVSSLELTDQQPIRVNDAGLKTANLCESVEAAHSAHDASAEIAHELGLTAAPVRIDSQCKYAMVANGSAGIYLRLPTRKDYVEKIWDHAAGALIVTEAGGRVTDTLGNPLNFGLGRGLTENKGIVVTNGRVHDEVIEAVRKVLY